MRIVRHKTFETNSSSTHSVSLTSGGNPTAADIEHSLGILRKHKIGAEVVIDFAARRAMDRDTLGCLSRVWAEGIDHTTPLEMVGDVYILGYGDVVGKLLITLAACMGNKEYDYDGFDEGNDDGYESLDLGSNESLKKSFYVRGNSDLVFTSKKYEDNDVSSGLLTLLDIMSDLAKNLQADIVFRTDRDLSEGFEQLEGSLEELYGYLSSEYYNVSEDINLDFILNPRAYVSYTVAEY